MNIYILNWTEYERGWGNRPDGLQVFTSLDKMNQVLNENKSERLSSQSVPDCYSIPTTKYVCDISKQDLNKMVGNENSTWFMKVGQRDIEYLKKTFKSLKVLATEPL